MVLRLYGDRMVEVINTMPNLIGDEWFEMIGSFHETVVSRVAEKNKFFQDKKWFKRVNFWAKFFFFKYIWYIMKVVEDLKYEEDNGW